MTHYTSFADSSGGIGGLLFDPDTPQAGLYQIRIIAASNTLADTQIVEISVTERVGSCAYAFGDANRNGIFNGLDVGYSVNYLKGLGPIPPDECDCPPHGILLAAADANGNCAFNGLDVTYSVNYLKGLGGAPQGCSDCEPVGLSPGSGADNVADK